jgi:hypothetical protein
MRTTYLIQQHLKLIDILEMMDKNQRYLRSDEIAAANYKAAGYSAWHTYPFFDSRKCEDRIERRKAVAARLKSYYLNTLDSVNEKTIL